MLTLALALVSVLGLPPVRALLVRVLALLSVPPLLAPVPALAVLVPAPVRPRTRRCAVQIRKKTQVSAQAKLGKRLKSAPLSPLTRPLSAPSTRPSTWQTRRCDPGHGANPWRVYGVVYLLHTPARV